MTGSRADQPRIPRRLQEAPTNHRWKTRTHAWVRWAHVYTSMISLLIVLFFGLTGITLNHPSWAFGDAVERQSFSGTLPAGTTDADDSDLLAISEFVREDYGIKGTITDYGVEQGEGTISYKGPGYAADLFFEADTGAFELNVEQQGFVAVMNDLHKGRDTGSSWRWLIDLSGGLLVLVAATGLGIQFFLRKRRTRALLFATAGAVLSMVAIFLTVA